MTQPRDSEHDAKMVRALRLPGRIYAALIPKAEDHAAHGDPDQDIADALSRPSIKRRGGGWSALIRLEPEDVLRLADWIEDDDPAELRRYRDAMRDQATEALG
jgi:hypothetical protein